MAKPEHTAGKHCKFSVRSVSLATRPFPAKAPSTHGSGQSTPGLVMHPQRLCGSLPEMFLVIIDTHSKWLEVLPVNNATTATTIEQLLNVRIYYTWVTQHHCL